MPRLSTDSQICIEKQHTNYISAGQCNRLEHPDNGTVTWTRLIEGYNATYTCDVGYLLAYGNQTRTCMSNGMWSGVEPICLRMYDHCICIEDIPSINLWAVILSAGICRELPEPRNGDVIITRVVDTSITEGSNATYTCNVGYQLSEGQSRTCMSNGMWSGRKPTCIRMKNAFVVCTHKIRPIYVAIRILHHICIKKQHAKI